MWLQPKFFCSNTHELVQENRSRGLNPAALFLGLLLRWVTTDQWRTRAGTQMKLDLLAVGSLFANTWIGPEAKGPSAPTLPYYCWQHSQRWWSQNVRPAKISFPASGCQPIELWGGRRGDTCKQRLFAPFHWEMLHLFFWVLMRTEFVQFEPQGRKRWCRTD